MTLVVPAKTPTAFREGDDGLGVWALQRALNAFDIGLTEDGAFGPTTTEGVRRYQTWTSLTRDGIAGPATQARLVRSLIARADPNGTLPGGLARSIVEGESANYIAAVNWNSPGGVDCGYTQRRVYDPLTDEALKRAFDSLYQLKLLRKRVMELQSIFRGRAAVDSAERAWRLAVLSHNYPAGADRLSRTKEADLSSYWKTPQQWVIAIGAQFDDGARIQTPLEWCKFYALGDSRHNHEGRMLKYVNW